MPQEVYFQVNKLLDDTRVNVTASAQQLLDLYASFDKETLGQVKTVEIVNLSRNIVYYGKDATVTTSNAGGVIRASEKIEIPLKDINWSPYFIAGSNSEIGLTWWG